MFNQFSCTWARRLVTAWLCAVIVGCGGSDSPQVDTGVQGIWYGEKHSETTGKVELVRAMVLADGSLRLLADLETEWAGVVSIDDSGNATLADGVAALETTSFPTHSNRATLTWTGSTLSARTLRGSYASGGETGDFVFTAQDTLFAGPSTLADLAGSYHYVALGFGGFFPSDFHITADGTLTGTEARGRFSGRVTQITAGRNAYKVNLSYLDAMFPGEQRFEYVTFASPDPPRQLLLFSELGVLRLVYTGP